MRKRRQLSNTERFQILTRDGFACQYCGERGANSVLHIDHIVPFSQGGPCEAWNLITACKECNHGKGAKNIRRLCLAEWIFTPKRIELNGYFDFDVTYEAERITDFLYQGRMVDDWVGFYDPEVFEHALMCAGGRPADPGKKLQVKISRADIGFDYGADISDLLSIFEQEEVDQEEFRVLDLFDIGPQSVMTWATDEMIRRSLSPSDAKRNREALGI